MKVVELCTGYCPATAAVSVLDQFGYRPEDQVVNKERKIVLIAPTGQPYTVTAIDHLNGTMHLRPSNLEERTPLTCA